MVCVAGESVDPRGTPMGWLATRIVDPGTAPRRSHRAGLDGVRRLERTAFGTCQEDMPDYAALGGWDHKV